MIQKGGKSIEPECDNCKIKNYCETVGTRVSQDLTCEEIKQMMSSMKKDISSLVQSTKEWLGEKGIKFFKDIKEKHGTINACWNEGGIPHSVHFREGMQIRNKMRGLTKGSWTAYEYDNNWVDLIEECIK